MEGLKHFHHNKVASPKEEEFSPFVSVLVEASN